MSLCELCEISLVSKGFVDLSSGEEILCLQLNPVLPHPTATGHASQYD